MNRDGRQQSIRNSARNNIVTKILIDFGHSGCKMFGSNKKQEGIGPDLQQSSPVLNEFLGFVEAE